MSLVNNALKFQMAILQIHCFSHFVNKNNNAFAYVVGIYLSSWGLNYDVKLTRFCTTGPRYLNPRLNREKDIAYSVRLKRYSRQWPGNFTIRKKFPFKKYRGGKKLNRQ